MRLWLKENLELLEHLSLLMNLRRHLALRAGFAPSTRKANFNPGEPRVPKHSPGGGQWTTPGGTTVTTSDGFLTGISQIDDTSRVLSDTLVKVIEDLNVVPESTPQLYGTLVHAAFAISVRLQDLPGIGFRNVERTFSLDASDPRYGLAGSIRTDVVLQNDQGDILAIYDVKTGARRMSRARANELRRKSGASPDTPVFELNVDRGVTKKNMRLALMQAIAGYGR
ncbi:MAG TPA: hypothetical protein VFL51_15965 [Pseudolabrys sp.]|nr:hypothetical protein [Pseudolabrys sp.]